MEEPLGASRTAGCAAGFLASAFLFNKERLNRQNQLIRLEREGAVADLELVIPGDRFGRTGRRRASVRDLRGEKRVLALFGPSRDLSACLVQGAGLRRRLEASGVVVVAVPSDNKRDDDQPSSSNGRNTVVPSIVAPAGGSALFPLAEPCDVGAWRGFFKSLLDGSREMEDESAARGSSSSSLSSSSSSSGFLALNFRGRSVLSGRGLVATAGGGGGRSVSSAGGGAVVGLNWDELLGSKFPPAQDSAPPAKASSTSDPAAAAAAAAAGEGEVSWSPAAMEASVVAAQEAFYEALTSGNEAAMQALFACDDDDDEGEGGGGGGGSGGANSSSEMGKAGLGFTPGTSEAARARFTPEVSSVVNAGGRLDDWAACLRQGSRPEGLVAFDHDATVLLLPTESSDPSSSALSDTETSLSGPGGEGEEGARLVALSTCIELLPGEKGANLSTKRWVRRRQQGRQQAQEGGEEWRLVLHSTIPYSAGFGAGGLLKCDCRGCVALVATARD